MTLLQLSDAHIVGTIISYLLGVFIVPLVISFSMKKGLVDNPGGRKIHDHPVSRLGGVSIWISKMQTFFVNTKERTQLMQYQLLIKNNLLFYYFLYLLMIHTTI